MGDDQSAKEDFIRKICDKRTTDAMGIVKAVNKQRHSAIEERILAHYQKTGRLITFESYLEIIRGIDSKDHLISIHRRNEGFGLDEIDDE